MALKSFLKYSSHLQNLIVNVNNTMFGIFFLFKQYFISKKNGLDSRLKAYNKSSPCVSRVRVVWENHCGTYTWFLSSCIVS